MAIDVFLSVGRTATPRQEAFVRAIEQCLLSQGLMPRAVGRSEFSSVQPLKRVEELMNECSGTVVVAFERLFVQDGAELRGNPNEEEVKNAAVPTPWNQIEAAMAYVLKQPILVIAEKGLRTGGLIDRGYDWYVRFVDLDPESCNSREFLGGVQDWKKRVESYHATKTSSRQTDTVRVDVDKLTVGQIVGALKPAQLWAMVGALASLVGMAYAVGVLLGSR